MWAEMGSFGRRNTAAGRKKIKKRAGNESGNIKLGTGVVTIKQTLAVFVISRLGLMGSLSDSQ